MTADKKPPRLTARDPEGAAPGLSRAAPDALLTATRKRAALVRHVPHQRRAKPWVRTYYDSFFRAPIIWSRRSAWRPQLADDTSILQQWRLPTFVRTALSLPCLTK